jgi:hypothetical protein
MNDTSDSTTRPDPTRAILDIAVHRRDWVNALYRLEACNARGCSAWKARSP